MSNYNIPVDILEFKTEITHLKIEDAFLRKVTQNRPEEPEEIIFLIYIGWFKTALTRQNNQFFLFDLLSRDDWRFGRTSGIVKAFWSYLREVEWYIHSTLLRIRSLEQPCFRFKFKHVNIDREMSTNLVMLVPKCKQTTNDQKQSKEKCYE